MSTSQVVSLSELIEYCKKQGQVVSGDSNIGIDLEEMQSSLPRNIVKTRVTLCAVSTSDFRVRIFWYMIPSVLFVSREMTGFKGSNKATMRSLANATLVFILGQALHPRRRRLRSFYQETSQPSTSFV